MEIKQFVLNKTLIILSTLALLASCDNKETARLKINVAEYSNQKVTIEEQRVAGKKFMDSLYFSSKGKLSYKFELKQPNFYNLELGNGEKLYLLLKPSDVVNITSDGSKLIFEGSEESEKLNYLYDSLFASRAILSELRQKYNLSVNEVYRDSLAKEYSRFAKNHYQFSIQFILENLTSLTSIAALYQELSPNEFVFSRAKDLQFFKLVSDSLIKYYPKHRHVLALKRNFNTMLESYQVDRLFSSASVVEEQLPEIELPDVNGRIRKLTELDKRYILLYFWNPNDQLSRDLFPTMNSVYKKYEGKNFAIYNVFFGKSLEAWKRIIRYEEIEKWTNVADTNFPNSKVQAYYNIQALPTSFLIDLETKDILARDINAAELNQKLARLLDI